MTPVFNGIRPELDRPEDRNAASVFHHHHHHPAPPPAAAQMAPRAPEVPPHHKKHHHGFKHFIHETVKGFHKAEHLVKKFVPVMINVAENAVAAAALTAMGQPEAAAPFVVTLANGLGHHEKLWQIGRDLGMTALTQGVSNVAGSVTQNLPSVLRAPASSVLVSVATGHTKGSELFGAVVNGQVASAASSMAAEVQGWLQAHLTPVTAAPAGGGAGGLKGTTAEPHFRGVIVSDEAFGPAYQPNAGGQGGAGGRVIFLYDQPFGPPVPQDSTGRTTTAAPRAGGAEGAEEPEVLKQLQTTLRDSAVKVGSFTVSGGKIEVKETPWYDRASTLLGVGESAKAVSDMYTAHGTTMAEMTAAVERLKFGAGKLAEWGFGRVYGKPAGELAGKVVETGFKEVELGAHSFAEWVNSTPTGRALGDYLAEKVAASDAYQHNRFGL